MGVRHMRKQHPVLKDETQLPDPHPQLLAGMKHCGDQHCGCFQKQKREPVFSAQGAQRVEASRELILHPGVGAQTLLENLRLPHFLFSVQCFAWDS